MGSSIGSSIFQAPPYDPRRERRKKIIVAVVIAVVVAIGIVVWMNRFYSYERVVTRFFNALENKNYEAAYAIWMADPNWKQHPQKYTQYPFNDFYRDWGPGGEWGVIRSFHVEGATNSGGSGIIVRVQVNHRAERADIWVEKKDKTLTFSPYETIQ